MNDLKLLKPKIGAVGVGVYGRNFSQFQLMLKIITYK